MEWEAFIENVKKMREHQRAWFKYHQSRDLIAAKELEKIVDQAVKVGVTPPPPSTYVEQAKQAGLFE